MSKNCTTQKSDKPSNHHKRWSEDDIKYVTLNYAAGADINLIASGVNRTVISVLSRLSLDGLVEFDKKEKAYYKVRAKLYQFPV